MTPLGTTLSLWLRYHYVGSDMFGNRYYEEKKPSLAQGKARRLVHYKGKAEATKIPPIWHAWMHHVTDKVPVTTPRTYVWQRLHVPNLTGTIAAYFPEGHVKRGGVRRHVSADYMPWQP